MPNRRFTISLAAALADLGLRHVCISPGSRNTPLIAGFSAEPRIRMWRLLDERAAGFFALGLARATGVPVALACTSGTAAVEYHPAVVEADLSEIPLLVLTADRPPELRGRGAPQTIDQISLFGTAVRMFADALTPDDDTPPETPGEIAIDIWAHATASPPGPVHLNLPFREPLLGPTETVDHIPLEPVDNEPDPTPDLSALANTLPGRRGLIVAGRSNDPNFPGACAAVAAATGFPIIADPLSGVRFGDHPLDNVLGYGDHLAAGGALDLLSPDVILRFGPVPTSKATWKWLEQHTDVEQILVDTQSRDATNSATTTIETDPTGAAMALAASVSVAASNEWLNAWLDLDAAVATLLAELEVTGEPAVARTVVAAAPEGSAITVGSSMPIRDIDSFAGKGSKRITLSGNRGANGIDGVVATALGVAAAGINSIVLVGDVSLFHDLNSLGTAAQLRLPVTVVVVNNDGGGIFHFLPQHDPDVLDPGVFETYLATPHGTDFIALATGFGIDAHDIDDVTELSRVIETVPTRPRLVQIRTDRDENLSAHRTISDAVRRMIR